MIGDNIVLLARIIVANRRLRLLGAEAVTGDGQDAHLFVVCRDGSFYDAFPPDIRKQGPWQGQRLGAVAALKCGYRLALARDGYVLVRCEAAVFKPEARCGILRDRISLGVQPN